MALLSTAATTVGLLTAVSVSSDVASADPSTPSAGQFVPVSASNLVRSAAGVGWSGQIQPGETKTVTASGAAGVPTTGVSAVMLHIGTWGSPSTGVDNGNLWVWPTGQSRPQYANLANAPSGSTADTTVIVELGTSGQLSFYNGPSAQPVNVNADVEGYITSDSSATAGATFEPVTPQRIINTNDGTGGRSNPLTSANSWTFHILGVGPIPNTGVAAAAVNLGAQSTTTNCWVQIQPTGTSLSSSSFPRVNTYAGYSAQQLAVIAPSASGDVDLSTNCPSVNVFADIEGYYLSAANGSTGDVYVPLASPTRIIDTRSNLGITGAMTAGRTVQGTDAVDVTGVEGGPPDGADAVALSLGTINGTTHGYDTVWTEGTPRPSSTSSIDVDPNVTESNLIFVQSGAMGQIDVAASSSDSTESSDIYADIEGYFIPPAPADISSSTMCVMPADAAGCAASPETTTSLNPILTAETSDSPIGMLDYHFQVWTSDGTNPTGSDPIYDADEWAVASGQTAQHVGAILEANTTYQYRVQATNQFATTNWSPWYYFRTSTTTSGVASTDVYQAETSAASRPCRDSDKLKGTVADMKHFMQCAHISYDVENWVDLRGTAADPVSNPSSDDPTTYTESPNGTETPEFSGGPSCTWTIRNVAKLCFHSGGQVSYECQKWFMGSYYPYHCGPVAAYTPQNDDTLFAYIDRFVQTHGKACLVGIGSAAAGQVVRGVIVRGGTGVWGGPWGIVGSLAGGCVAGAARDWWYGRPGH